MCLRSYVEALISSCGDREQRDKPLQCLALRTRVPPCSRPWYAPSLRADLCNFVILCSERMGEDGVIHLSNSPLYIFSRSPSLEIRAISDRYSRRALWTMA